MPDTTLLLNGFSIVGDPQTNTNASNGGELFIRGGTEIFEDDDVIAFIVQDATVDGVLTDDSIIVQAIVYDNATDFFNDVAKYTYNAAPGDGVDIETGRNNMGDRYLEFDASPLVSTDPGAPVLGDMAVIAGVDILGTLETINGPLEIPTNEDIDLDGDGVISPDEAADGSFSSDLNILTTDSLICFAAGTLIETPTGPQAIETLREGNLINTLDQGPLPIQWIGGRKTVGVGAHAPVFFRRGAIGNVRDLWVSQNHRMLVRGPRAELLFGEPEVLVAAKHLVDGKSVRIVPCATVEYWHFLLEGHQIVFAEACPTESLFPGQQALKSIQPDERDEIVTLFPKLEDHASDVSLSRYALKGFEAQAWRLSA